MIKKFIIVAICFLISATSVLAKNENNTAVPSESAKNHALELLTKVKNHRTSIYVSLQLTEEQVVRINEIDKKLYAEIEPEFQQLSLLSEKIENIANSGNCTKKAVNSIKKEFKAVEKEMTPIKNRYEKEFAEVLTPEQKITYRTVKKQKRAEFKKEMERQRTSMKRQRKN